MDNRRPVIWFIEVGNSGLSNFKLQTPVLPQILKIGLKSEKFFQLRTVEKLVQKHLYSPSCLGQETAKGPLRSSCQAATCLPHTVEASHCSILLLNVKQGSYKYQFL